MNARMTPIIIDNKMGFNKRKDKTKRTAKNNNVVFRLIYCSSMLLVESSLNLKMLRIFNSKNYEH